MTRWRERIFASPLRRRFLIRLWRVWLRLERATVANAVLILRAEDGRILVWAKPSGGVRLPAITLDAWRPIATQVEERLARLLPRTEALALVAVDGAPGEKGVTFLYVANLEGAPAGEGDGRWLEPQAALLDVNDRELLVVAESSKR